MKMTTFVLLATCLSVSAKGLSQQVDISAKHATLKSLLNKISRQTGLSVFCDEALLQHAALINIQAKHVSVQTVLDECLRNQGLRFRIADGTIFIDNKVNYAAVQNALQAQYALPVEIVHGRVTDTVGMPISDASVTIVGTTKGTSTNSKGEFSIDASKGDVLEIKYVGYTTQRATVGDADIIVLLKLAASTLNDVVIVAYGSQKKINLTGAVDQISGKEIQDRPVVNIADALQGKMASLNISTSSSGMSGGVLRGC